MRRLLRRILVAMAALVAAFVMYTGVTLPPAARELPASGPRPIAGAFHVHTNRSGGSGTVDDVAAAAAAAGLQFVVVTDHGDATREPDPPAYRHGVLVIDAAEVTTRSGHLVVLGLRHGAPYPLGAGARDTISDVHRMGGWAVAAHPDSPKPDLAWVDPRAPVDGVEWLNADSEWRDEEPAALMTTIAHYLVRPAAAIASVFDRPVPSLRRWDAMLARRSVVALAAVDAHARIGFESPDDASSGVFLARPSYEDMFRTAVQVLDRDRPLTGDPLEDGTAVLEGLRLGATYSMLPALAAPGRVAFTATQGTRVWRMGQSVTTDEASVTLHASVPAPADATVVLLRDGEAVASGKGSVTFVHAGGPAVYRVEVQLDGHRVPWIVTNAIRVGLPDAVSAEPEPPAGRVVRSLEDHTQWTAEKHLDSEGDLARSDTGVALRFQLGPGPPAGQYAALVYPLSGQDRFDAISLTVQASAPMRVSLQLRAPGGAGERRWRRSIFVDTQPRAVTVPLAEFEPVEPPAALPIPLDDIRSLLLVVDTWHTRPGTAGQVQVSGVLLRAREAQAAVTSER